jgi:glycosyltransferase involved in cell wall biosynthesis
MTILHTETLKGWGGQQNKTLKELLAAKTLGHTVHLVCNPNAAIAERAAQKGIPVHRLEMNKKNYHHTIPWMLNFIQKENIDLIVSHGSTDSWIVAIGGNLSRRKPKLVRERHNLFPVKGWLSKWQHRKLFDRILVLGEAVETYLVTDVGVEPSRCFTLPDIVDIDIFDTTVPNLRKLYDIPAEAPIVGVVTSLTKAKGVYDFFETAKTLLREHADLYIVFGGNYSNKAKEAIDAYFARHENLAKRVIWTGFVDNPAAVMKDLDIFLFPSHSEGLGTVILEAMVSRLPVITYNIPPMNQLVEHGINGLTVPFKDIDALKNAVEILLQNPQKREKMGQNGYEKVSKNFSEAVLTERMATLLGALR